MGVSIKQHNDEVIRLYGEWGRLQYVTRYSKSHTPEQKQEAQAELDVVFATLILFGHEDEVPQSWKNRHEGR